MKLNSIKTIWTALSLLAMVSLLIPAALAASSEPSVIINEDAPSEDIYMIQYLLMDVGLLSPDFINGVYNAPTIGAVADFQDWVNSQFEAPKVEVTGEVDMVTLAHLRYCSNNKIMVIDGSDESSKPRIEFDYKAINRNPDKYNGERMFVSGRVYQIIEGKKMEGGQTRVEAIIATDGSYDDLVFVFYYRGEGEDRILENDVVTIDATAFGLYTYESVLHVPITLPQFFVWKVVDIK